MAKDNGIPNPPPALNHRRHSPSTSLLKPSGGKTSKKFIQSVAAKISAHPFRCSDPTIWGVLTVISEKAHKPPQGSHMLLTSNVHEIGRVVDDYRFCFRSPAISALHCKIYRRRVASEDTQHGSDPYFSVFVKDYSTNGTFVNWEKLNKRTHEAKLRHGDIISFPFAPEHERALVFVFREVQKSSCVSDGSSLKRKSEEYGAKNKRLKRIGVGTSDGPISLDDFRSLQRSNTELKKNLEIQVATVEFLRTENRAAEEKHETQELRESKEAIAKSHQDQLRQLNHSLEAKEKELEELTKISAGLKHGMEDLNKKLSASTQLCLEANETIDSQKASISELKAVLDEERDQRRGEREKVSLDMKTALQSLTKELECEKAAREEACTKVFTLELEISAAMKDLGIERRTLEGARERIIICETQLHAFHSTTEKMSALLTEQQEQFKAMQRTLKDEKNNGALFPTHQEQFESLQRTLEEEENNGTASIDINLNRVENRSPMDQDNNNKEVAHQSNITTAKDQAQIFSDEPSLTKMMNDCSNAKSQEKVIDTQEVEFNGFQCGINNNAKGILCSDVDGMVEISHGDVEGTEHVLEMDSQIARILIGLNKIATNSPVEVQDPMDHTGVKTKDHLASDILCRWARITPPSVHVENNSHTPPVYDSSRLVVEVKTCHQPRREGLRPRRGMRRV